MTITVGIKTAPFSWLPNYLVNNLSVSAEVLAVALYLNGKPEGWRCRPFDVRHRFGWGRDKWLSVSRNLKAHGLLTETKVPSGTVLTFGIPVVERQDLRATDPGAENPHVVENTARADFTTVGKPDPLEKKERANKKKSAREQSKSKNCTLGKDNQLAEQPANVEKALELAEVAGIRGEAVVNLIKSCRTNNLTERVAFISKLNKALNLYIKRGETKDNPARWLNACITGEYWLDEKHEATAEPKAVCQLYVARENIFRVEGQKVHKEALRALESVGIVEPVWSMEGGLSDSQFFEQHDSFQIELSDKILELERQ